MFILSVTVLSSLVAEHIFQRKRCVIVMPYNVTLEDGSLAVIKPEETSQSIWISSGSIG